MTVTGVRGGDRLEGGVCGPEDFGQDAAAVWLDESRLARLYDVLLDGPKGGSTTCSQRANGWGGRGVGVRLTDARRNTLRAVTVDGARGGDAGDALGEGAGGRGGDVLGVWLEAAARENVIAGLHVKNSRGGVGGDGHVDFRPGATGSVVGVRLEEDSFDNAVLPSSRVEDTPIIYAFAKTGGEITGHQVLGAQAPTNWGSVVCIRCTDVHIHHNRVSGGRGVGAPQVGAAPERFDRGGGVTGILVRESEGVTVADNEVSDLIGGEGHTNAKDHDGGRGGDAHGVVFDRCTRSCSADRNHLHDLTGGRGGVGGGNGRGPGDGGSAYGIATVGAPEVTTSWNRIHDLVGAEETGAAREGAGYGLSVDPSAVSEHDLVYRLRGSPWTSCLNALADSTLTVEHLTCHDAQNLLLPDPGAVARISSSIASKLPYSSVHASQEHGISATLAWTVLHDVGEWVIFRDLQLVGDQPTGDPLFRAPALGDYALQAGSSAIDAGDPGDPLGDNCPDEPVAAEGGCRLDAGHLGGTARACTASAADGVEPCGEAENDDEG